MLCIRKHSIDSCIVFVKYPAFTSGVPGAISH